MTAHSTLPPLRLLDPRTNVDTLPAEAFPIPPGGGSAGGGWVEGNRQVGTCGAPFPPSGASEAEMELDLYEDPLFKVRKESRRATIELRLEVVRGTLVLCPPQIPVLRPP